MDYEITLTLRPHMYRHPADAQHRLCKEYLQTIFKRDLMVGHPRHRKLTLVAELTQENNVHYHGIVRLTGHVDRARLLERFREYHKIFGKKTVTQLMDYPKWVKYINKDVAKTADIIGDPVVCDDYTVMCDERYRFQLDSDEDENDNANDEQ